MVAAQTSIGSWSGIARTVACMIRGQLSATVQAGHFSPEGCVAERLHHHARPHHAHRTSRLRRPRHPCGRRDRRSYRRYVARRLPEVRRTPGPHPHAARIALHGPPSRTQGQVQQRLVRRSERRRSRSVSMRTRRCCRRSIPRSAGATAPHEYGTGCSPCRSPGGTAPPHCRTVVRIGLTLPSLRASTVSASEERPTGESR